MTLERLLTRKQVESIVSLSRSSIYGMIANNSFPKPIRIGRRAVRFLQSDIEAWLQAKMEGQK
ncbi:AlpA family phage regulatory protein [Sphingomonas sp. NIC1]|uniref:helix-turn-helix transcriptional regulator n=1 Tax=Sphingomonas sp. NIC1 TaxID=1961362 RepID=UPI0009962863